MSWHASHLLPPHLEDIHEPRCRALMLIKAAPGDCSHRADTLALVQQNGEICIVTNASVELL